MVKKAIEPGPKERPFKTTRLHLPEELWVLLNRVACERVRTKRCRPSVSALLVQLIERDKRELEKELALATR